MADVMTNPLNTDGFEFVEYSAPNQQGIDALKNLFDKLGFTEVAKHKSKQAWLYKQNDINFIVNAEPGGQAEDFSKDHGPSVCGMAWRVQDADHAFNHSVENGAKAFPSEQGAIDGAKAVYGIGESVLYFIDNYSNNEIYQQHFDFYDNWQTKMNEHAAGLYDIDHLTHNVFRGNMDTWAGFYERIGNFREIRYFDIEGKLTGLLSRAMTAPCGKIRIPINESHDDKSQIEEYLREYKGEGIQHIALTSDNIYQTVKDLRSIGMDFMDTPDTYYDKIDERVEGHDEDVAALKDQRILIDGAPMKDGILLQIFTQTVIGPVFFEIIQRKGNEGFGEGNFKALFESIEEDQIRRGVLSDA